MVQLVRPWISVVVCQEHTSVRTAEQRFISALSTSKCVFLCGWVCVGCFCTDASVCRVCVCVCVEGAAPFPAFLQCMCVEFCSRLRTVRVGKMSPGFPYLLLVSRLQDSSCHLTENGAEWSESSLLCGAKANHGSHDELWWVGQGNSVRGVNQGTHLRHCRFYSMIKNVSQKYPFSHDIWTSPSDFSTVDFCTKAKKISSPYRTFHFSAGSFLQHLSCNLYFVLRTPF